MTKGWSSPVIYLILFCFCASSAFVLYSWNYMEIILAWEHTNFWRQKCNCQHHLTAPLIYFKGKSNAIFQLYFLSFEWIMKKSYSTFIKRENRRRLFLWFYSTLENITSSFLATNDSLFYTRTKKLLLNFSNLKLNLYLYDFTNMNKDKLEKHNHPFVLKKTTVWRI